MQIRVVERAGLALATGALGCPSTALYRTAEPVPAGQWQVSLAGGGGGFADREQEASAPTGHAELGLRRGFSDDLDVGLKLYTFGFAANATIRFLHRGAWSIAVAPELSVARTPRNATSTNAVHLFGVTTVPVTWRASRTWALSFGPAVGGGIYLPEAGGRAGGMWLGAFVNVEARLANRWWLVPELSGYQVVVGDVPLRGGVLVFGVGVRFAF